MTFGGRRCTLVAVLAIASFSVTAARLIAASVSTARPHSAPRHTIFRDGFESESFSAWSQVQLGGDAKAIVQSAFVKSGSVAAELAETADRGSRVDVRKAFRGAYTNLTATGDFRILQQGKSGVPLLSLLDARSNPVATVSRRGGSIDVAYGRSHFSTAKLALNRWASIAVHVIILGARSTVEVRLNGRRIFLTRRARLHSAGVSILQIGDAAAAQSFKIVADAINVQAAGWERRSLPISTGLPSISGTLQAGRTATAGRGTWGGTPATTYGYLWLRCDSRGLGCHTIPGASGATYRMTGADVGRRLRVVVAASNSVGVARSTSHATALVQSASAPPLSRGLPTISGTPKAGLLLNADSGAWSGTQPIRYRYEWLRCSSAGAGCGTISGATSASYLVRGEDVGDTLRVLVTAANAVGSAGATSGATAVVQPGSTHPTFIALWHMNETSGKTMVDSIGDHDGTLFHVELGLPGLSGFAYGFNGASSYVSVPSAADLNPGAANVTMTIHLQTTGTPPPPPADWDLFRKGLYTSSGAEMKMEFQQSGQASCGFEGSHGYSELIAGPAINDGQWHTVQCSKTASTIEVIVDGVAYSQPANVGSITNTAPVVIGARPGSDWYHGALDEASIQIG